MEIPEGHLSTLNSPSPQGPYSWLPGSTLPAVGLLWMRLPRAPAPLQFVGNATRALLLRDASASSAEEHRVSALPGLPDLSLRSPHYAGYINIDRQTDSNLFYWLFDAEDGSAGRPLLVWLNGGPGCSSMDGLFLEVGPLRMRGGRLEVNPHSWHRHANILFVDQPVGTGYSFTRGRNSYPTSYPEVSEQFYRFLLNFLRLHPRFLSSKDPKRTVPIYICGNTYCLTPEEYFILTLFY